jgi:cytoskeleton protein RodZ
VLHERKARLVEGHASMSSTQGDNPSVHGRAPRVGAELRGARQEHGWDLDELAASLRIRASYLEAIEDGRIADLPGNAYALGFLRTYAATLGLDPDDVSRRFRAEVAEVNAKTELTFPAPVPDRGVPAGAVVLIGLMLAVGAYVGWYRLAEHAPPAHAVAPVPEKLARLADPTSLAPVQLIPRPVPAASPAPVRVPASPAATPPSAPPASAGADSALSASVPPSSAVVIKSPTSETPVAALPSAAAAPSSEAAPASDAALAAVATLAPPAAAATRPKPRGMIVIHATSPAWIEVRDSTGAVVFTKLMQPGDSWTAPQRAGLVLTTGNAGGTELLVGGTPAPPLGAPGMVVRDQPLDAGLIKAGALPAQIAAAASGAAAYTPAAAHTP